MSAVSPHTLSIQTTLQIVDSKLQDLGSGPHTPSQAEEHKKLTIHKQKLVQQMKASMQGVTISLTPTVPSQSIVMQATSKLPSTHINMQPMMAKSVIGNQPQQVIIAKSQQASHAVASFINQSNSESQDKNKLLDKKRIQDLVNEIDPNMQLDDDLEEVFIFISNIFIYF